MFQEETLVRFLLRVKQQLKGEVKIIELQLRARIHLLFQRIHLDVNLFKTSLHHRMSKFTSNKINTIINYECYRCYKWTKDCLKALFLCEFLWNQQIAIRRYGIFFDCIVDKSIVRNTSKYHQSLSYSSCFNSLREIRYSGASRSGNRLRKVKTILIICI